MPDTKDPDVEFIQLMRDASVQRERIIALLDHGLQLQRFSPPGNTPPAYLQMPTPNTSQNDDAVQQAMDGMIKQRDRLLRDQSTELRKARAEANELREQLTRQGTGDDTAGD